MMKNPVTASLGRVGAIALNTFMEAYRNRAFLGLGIVAVGLVMSSIAISRLAIADQASRVLVDFGLFAIALLEVVIAIVMGVILIYKEVDRKTFYLVLPKPVRRSEVVAGKFAGLLVVLAISLVVMGVAWILSLVGRGIEVRPDMIKALALVWLEASLITSVALFFSSFATPIMSGVFSFGMFLVGRSLIILEELLTAKKGMIVQNDIIKTIASFCVDVFPDLSVFNISKEIIVGVPVGWDYVGGAALYSIGYCVFFIALAMVIFSRRDFV